MKNILVAFFTLFALSCGHKDQNETNVKAKLSRIANERDIAAPEKPNVGVASNDVKGYDAGGNAGIAITDTSKKIVKEGNISFETINVNETRRIILHALKKWGGYVDEDNQSLNNDNNRKEYTLKVRIPAKNFDSFLDSVSSAADKIDEKNINATDVTTRYIDITTRLANKKILENRYLELLKKSTKVSDLLEIENKLAEIRSDIESTQGQLNYLNKQVAYSSLTITFYTKQTTVEDKPEGFGFKLKEAIKGGADLVQTLFFGFIGIWPVWIVIIAIYLFFRARRKRRSKKAV